MNQNPEAETPAHTNEQQHATIEAEVLKIVQHSLPSLLATALGTATGMVEVRVLERKAWE